MRVVIVGPDGEVSPPDALEYVTREKDVRHYRCRACLEIIYAPTGEETVHRCKTTLAEPERAFRLVQRVAMNLSNAS